MHIRYGCIFFTLIDSAKLTQNENERSDMSYEEK